jgi:hypothetical protein
MSRITPAPPPFLTPDRARVRQRKKEKSYAQRGCEQLVRKFALK